MGKVELIKREEEQMTNEIIEGLIGLAIIICVFKVIEYYEHKKILDKLDSLGGR